LITEYYVSNQHIFVLYLNVVMLRSLPCPLCWLYKILYSWV